MLAAFKRNNLLQILFILIAVILLWVKAFLSPAGMAVEHYFSPLYGLLHDLLSSCPKVAAALALLLIVVEGVWLNLIMSYNKLGDTNWLMPTLLFILAMGWQGGSLTLTPMTVAWLPLLAAASQLLSRGDTSLGVSRNFNAAFLVGIATMCYLPAVVFVVPFLLSFVSYKAYRWRDLVVAILGLTAPLLLLVVYAFLTDKLEYYLILFRHDIVDMHIVTDTSDMADIVSNILFILILLWAFLSQLMSLGDTTIQHRINTVVFMLPLTAALLMLPYGTVFVVDTQGAALPFAFLVSNLLAIKRKHSWINELVFCIILLGCLLANA